MLEAIKSIPAKMKELEDLFENHLVGWNIESTENYTDFEAETTWTFVYKYDREMQSFKVNHAGKHMYMPQADLWNILEHATDIKKR